MSGRAGKSKLKPGKDHSSAHEQQPGQGQNETTDALRQQWLKGLNRLKLLDGLNSSASSSSPSPSSPPTITAVGTGQASASSSGNPRLQELINELYPLALNMAKDVQSLEEYNELLNFAEYSIRGTGKIRIKNTLELTR